MKGKILFLVNLDYTIYNFRKELVESLLEIGYDIYLSCPYGPLIDKFADIGCICIDIRLDRHGTNPIKDLILLNKYRRIIKIIKPDIVLSYTVKPNVYGGMVCRFMKVPHIATITGMGSAMVGAGAISVLLSYLYRIALRKSNCVYFQKQQDLKYFKKKNIIKKRYKMTPGSGVNLQHFRLLDYPMGQQVIFLFVSRIRKDKGIDEFLDAVQLIKHKHHFVEFHVLGFCEDNYEEKLSIFERKGLIKYHNWVDDVISFYRVSHCIIHPTFYPEGISNVLLESAACGRPAIATNTSGCKEIVDDGISGYLCEPKNSNDLVKKIELFIKLDYTAKRNMGIAARRKVEKLYDRKFVISSYIEEINKVLQKPYVPI